MMGSIPLTGKKTTYWFEYEYLNKHNKWVKQYREFGTENAANRAHLTMTIRRHRNQSGYRNLTPVSYKTTWHHPAGNIRRKK